MKFRKLFEFLIPPLKWKFPVIIALGIFTGLSLVVYRISNAASYLSNDPQTCMNCHVMAPQFASWQHSSHARDATCNDCHVPHNNIINSYLFKARDGLRHATIFTFRLEPQVIRIKEAGIKVVEQNCIRCHSQLVERTLLMTAEGEYVYHKSDRLCWDCHRETPHGRVNSLSAVPFARIPKLSPVIPEWLYKYTLKKSDQLKK
jgi:cytochrome c nitrite reductase small subunit